MQAKATNGLLPLLHVDDSANERLMVRHAIEITKTPFNFEEADCIESAVPYFERQPWPAIVLLDYDMGRHTGVDFLIWLRGLKNITSVPVAMFTGSVGGKHIVECYANGANYFLSKPKYSERLQEIVRTLYEAVALRNPSMIRSLEEFQPDLREQRTSQKSF